MNRKALAIVASIAAAAALTAFVVLAGSSGDGGFGGLFPGSRADSAADEAAKAPGSLAAKAPGAVTGVSNEPGSGDASASVDATPATGSGEPTGSAGASGETTPGKPPATPARKSIKLLIRWYDDTRMREAEGFEIAFADRSYKLDPDAPSGDFSIGPVYLGESQQLVVYPDGRDGKKVVIPITADSAMKPVSEQDAIHVSVSDNKVRVLGNPVENFDHTLPRF